MINYNNNDSSSIINCVEDIKQTHKKGVENQRK